MCVPGARAGARRILRVAGARAKARRMVLVAGVRAKARRIMCVPDTCARAQRMKPVPGARREVGVITHIPSPTKKLPPKLHFRRFAGAVIVEADETLLFLYAATGQNVRPALGLRIATDQRTSCLTSTKLFFPFDTAKLRSTVWPQSRQTQCHCRD